MSHGYIFFEIQADDVNRAVGFYKSVFDWKFNKQPNLPIEYWDIETGGSRGGLLQRPAKTPPPEHGTNAFVCSLGSGKFRCDRREDHEGRRAGGLGKIPRPRQVLAGILHRHRR